MMRCATRFPKVSWIARGWGVCPSVVTCCGFRPTTERALSKNAFAAARSRCSLSSESTNCPSLSMARYKYAHWPFTAIDVSSTYQRRPARWCRFRRKCSASRVQTALPTQHHLKHNVCGHFQEIERCARALIERLFAALTPEAQITQTRGLGKHDWVREWATGQSIGLPPQPSKPVKPKNEF